MSNRVKVVFVTKTAWLVFLRKLFPLLLIFMRNAQKRRAATAEAYKF